MNWISGYSSGNSSGYTSGNSSGYSSGNSSGYSDSALYLVFMSQSFAEESVQAKLNLALVHGLARITVYV